MVPVGYSHRAGDTNPFGRYPGGQPNRPDSEDRRHRVRYPLRPPERDFQNLRGKGRLSEADIDATAREIRIALLEADVALPVVRTFIKNVKERALGSEVSKALNPAQQVLKIVNDELVTILGGETRRLRFAKNPPTVIMLAGLQGAGKTTLAGKLGKWLRTRATPRCWSPPTSSARTP